ncbi:MAG: exodeoxyribonuclease VII small subunit [Chloroflexi bacterium]|nr:exodeoxyribonuclease VII small subunit [Chloroflexota bacterium]
MTEQNRNGDADFSDFSFEQALGRLDEAVQTLEAGGLDLAESTRMFENGMKLARVCSDMLAATELRISRIQTAYGEQMRMLEREEEVGQED